MGKQELSISFRSEAKESELQRTAEAAGRYGFDVVSVYEDLGDPSPMYPLMTFRKHTTARVGPACIVVPKYATLEPIVGDIARLDAAHPGKAYLGYVSGAWMDQVGLKPATVKQMREAIEVSQYLLRKQDDGYTGEFYAVKPGFTVNYEMPRNPVPLLIGAWSEKMAALGGELADEIKVGGSVNPTMVGVVRERARLGALRAGRSIDDIGIVMGAVTVVDEDREAALRLARRKAAMYVDAIGDKDITAMAEFPEEVKTIKQAVRNGDIDLAAKSLPDALAKKFIMAGDPHDIIGHVEELFTAGASRVEFGTPHGLDEVNGIRLLGEKVLPYFKKK